MIEIQAADTFVYSALAADSTLTGLIGGSTQIFNQTAPDGTNPPYVVFDNKPSTDTITNGLVRVMASFQCTVQAVIYEDGATGDTKLTADQIAGLIQTDLFTNGVAQNGYWITCYRSRPFNRGQYVKNRAYRLVGATFTLNLRPLTSG